MDNTMKKVLLFLGGVIAGIITGEATDGKIKRDALRKTEEDNMKFREFYGILLRWIHIRNEGKSIGTYLYQCGYCTAAIYGMKELGKELFYELKESEVKVKYAIDKNADDLYAEIDVYRPDEKLEPVDVVIVTAVHWFDDIEKDIKSKLRCPILSLEDVVYDV